MDPLYLRKLRINQQQNPIKNTAAETQNADKNTTPQNQQNGQSVNLNTQSARLMNNMREEMLTPKQIKMNYIAGIEQADYVKKVMNLPKTLPELLIQLQNPNLGKAISNAAGNIPQPDTQSIRKINPDAQNSKNQNDQNNSSTKNDLIKNSEGFNEVLQKESDRKQAVLQHYNRKQPASDKQTENKPQQNIQSRIQNKQEPQNTVQNRYIADNNRTDNEIIHKQDMGRNIEPRQIMPDTGRFNLGIRQDRFYDTGLNTDQNYIPNRQNETNTRINNNINNRIQDREDFHHINDRRFNPVSNRRSEAAANLYTNLSMNDMNNPTITQMRQRLSDDAFELLFTGIINLRELSETLKNGGNDARSKLILAMANASRQGIDNSQIANTMKLVNLSMATEDSNPASILKNIILLYLPWYPLQEGVGFNLSINTLPNNNDFSSFLKVFIQTRNYGNVNGSLILMSANTVDMNIQCNDIFPEEDLLDRMKDVTQNHSIRSNITVEQKNQIFDEIETNRQAKVNLSSVYELNPFLLLMAHSFIKNTIIIDSTANV